MVLHYVFYIFFCSFILAGSRKKVPDPTGSGSTKTPQHLREISGCSLQIWKIQRSALTNVLGPGCHRICLDLDHWATSGFCLIRNRTSCLDRFILFFFKLERKQTIFALSDGVNFIKMVPFGIQRRYFLSNLPIIFLQLSNCYKSL